MAIKDESMPGATKRSPQAAIPTVFGTPEQVAAQKKFVEEHTTVEVDGREIPLKEYMERMIKEDKNDIHGRRN